MAIPGDIAKSILTVGKG